MSRIVGPIPEHIRKLMPTETRKELRAPTSAEAQAKLDAGQEKDLQADIAALLTIREICFFWQRTDRKTTGTVGWPDFTFAVKGHAVAFEAKTKTGTLSPEQHDCHLKLALNGWTVAVIRSLQQAVEALNQLEGSTNG